MAHVSHKLSNSLEGALAGGGDPATSPLYVFGPFLKLLVVAGVAQVTFGASIWLVVLTIAVVSAMYRLVMIWVTDGSGGSGLSEEEFGSWAVKINASITFIEYTLTFLVSVAALVTLWGWRAGFWGPGGLCIVVAVGLYLLMQDRPQTMGLPPVADWRNDHSGSSAEAGQAKESTWAVQRTILKIPAIWVLALASASIYVTRYAINSWGVLYLQEAKGYSLMQAGGAISVNTIAGILGALAFGFTSDKVFNARRPPTNVIFAVMEIVDNGTLLVGGKELTRGARAN